MPLKRVAVTGSVGTGKTALGRALASRLGLEFFSVTDLVNENQFLSLSFSNGEHEVDVPALKDFLSSSLPASFVVESHLLCEFKVDCDILIVLRCNPSVLLKRLSPRNYSEQKLASNVLSEMIDYCVLESEKRYAPEKILVLDNTSFLSTDSALEKISSMKSDEIDWSESFSEKELSLLLSGKVPKSASSKSKKGEKNG